MCAEDEFQRRPKNILNPVLKPHIPKMPKTLPTHSNIFQNILPLFLTFLQLSILIIHQPQKQTFILIKQLQLYLT